MIENATKLEQSNLEAQCQLGASQLSSGELAKAFESFQKALQINSDSFKAVYGLGQVQHQRKIFVSVGRLYAKATKLAKSPKDLRKVEESRKQLTKDVLNEAAEFYEGKTAALRLRELQTLAEIAREKNLIIVPAGNIGTVAGIAKAVNKKVEE